MDRSTARPGSFAESALHPAPGSFAESALHPAQHRAPAALRSPLSTPRPLISLIPSWGRPSVDLVSARNEHCLRTKKTSPFSFFSPLVVCRSRPLKRYSLISSWGRPSVDIVSARNDQVCLRRCTRLLQLGSSREVALHRLPL